MLRTVLTLSLVFVPASLLAAYPKIPSRPALPTVVTSLSQQVVVPAGHLVAIAANSYFPTLAKLTGNFDAPVIFQYDRDNDQLVITINGGRDNADGAKETMELFRANFEPAIVAMSKAVFGVELSDDNISLVYMKRKSKKVTWAGKAVLSDARTVLLRLKGKYVMP